MKIPKIINAISFVEDDLISAANNQKAKPFYIKPVFKRATAIAACLVIVAVTAFTLTKKPDNNISSNNSSNDSSNASNQSGGSTSNNSSDISQDDNVIYVTGDEHDDYAFATEIVPSLHQVYISPKLQEKMAFYKDYKDKEVIYRVIVQILATVEDGVEAGKLADANKEVQLLFEQKEAARLEEQKARADHNALWNANPEWQVNPENYPEITAESERLVAIIKEKKKNKQELQSKWQNLRLEIGYKYIQEVRTERLKFAAQFSEKEPVSASNEDLAFYMDLTAEEINILAEKGGYMFILSSGDDYTVSIA